LIVFPDENHWVLNHGNRYFSANSTESSTHPDILFVPISVKWHYEVFRWFDKFVGERE
jgi:hypothetical protein